MSPPFALAVATCRRLSSHFGADHLAYAVGAACAIRWLAGWL